VRRRKREGRREREGRKGGGRCSSSPSFSPLAPGARRRFPSSPPRSLFPSLAPRPPPHHHHHHHEKKKKRKHSQYLQSLRNDDLRLFRCIQARDGAWWHPATDRGGTGCSLHAAAGACAPRSVRFLIEVAGVPVNVRAASDGATPLHRAAAVAHHADPRAMEVVEFLLSRGADPGARTRGSGEGGEGAAEEGEAASSSPSRRRSASSLSVLDCAVERGHGRQVGEVRRLLREAVRRHSGVPKAPLESLAEEGARRRRGPRPPPVAAAGAALLRTWRQLAPSLPYPPVSWRPPPPAGWAGAVGILACGGGASGDGGGTAAASPSCPSSGWRPAGSPGDGSCWLRRATKAELDAQAAAAAAAAAEPE